MKKIIFIFSIFIFNNLGVFAQQPIYLNPSEPIEKRVQDLISKMTLEEKVNQMNHKSPAISHLNIPAYNWWNEALHGVGRSGLATVFPQAIGLAATFDENLIYQVASAISDEARATYNVSTAKGYHLQYSGLTFWTPNINIFRDPRWGRGQETYGEDPFLTARLGVNFVKGLQGNHPNYLKTAACAKHYAVHSGPERLRHEFDAKANLKDLRETYLPAFKALVDAKVEAVMCAYNRTNGEVCCASNTLLNEILKKEWNFKGHIVSDCWAVVDFYKNGHNIVKTQAEAAALAVKHGVSLNCGDEYPALVEAVQKGLITEKEIDNALSALLTTRFKLGMFDPKDSNPFNKLGAEVINSPKHRELAYQTAVKSAVLLKNNGVLPLKNDLAQYFLTGPNADNIYSLIGNYYGVNPNMVTFLEGLTASLQPGSQMQYRPGILLDRDNANEIDWTTGAAKSCDATFVVLGINGYVEGEEGEAIASPYFGDRLDYNLPKNQIAFLKKLRANNKKPIIAIITGGSPMNLSEVHELADAVILAWYPGEEGGNAIADIIFGKVSPSGKLPITFPKSLDQLPAYEDYAMKGRTYRYMSAEPMYPFGFGLSYTNFQYADLKISSNKIKKNQSVELTVKVSNTGKFESDEVVQLYISDVKASTSTPLYALKGFQRIHLKAGESTVVKFMINPEMLMLVDDSGKNILEPGDFKIYIGNSVPNQRSLSLGASPYQEILLNVK
jgi:beta-glucosidase